MIYKVYKAEDNIIYYINPIDNYKEVFITINPNQRNSTKTPKEQAIFIANILNGDI